MFEKIASIDKIKTAIGDGERVGVALHERHSGSVDGGRELIPRFLDAEHLHAFGRIGDCCGKHSEPASNFQHLHSRSDIQEPHERLVRQAVKRGESLLFARLRPVDVGVSCHFATLNDVSEDRQASRLLDLRIASVRITTPQANSASACDQSVSRPTPFRKMPRRMITK